MKTLVIIPARGGSKGIPHKNIKPLCGKPLIYYTIDVARSIVPDSQICVSTDDLEIIKITEDYGLKVPFIRPAELSTDQAGTYGVLLHALNFYEKNGETVDNVILLQNTSPLRTSQHLKEALSLYRSDIDMVVSVCEAETNPYYGCYEDNNDGYLQISKGDGSILRRQDAPKAWEYNGAIYIINPMSLKLKPLGKFTRRIKYVMPREVSIDLDTMLDWKIAELMIKDKDVYYE